MSSLGWLVTDVVVAIVIVIDLIVGRDRVLLVSIAAELVLRGLFILAGAAAFDCFSATFYLFDAFLIFTAVRLICHRGLLPDIPAIP